MTRLVRINEQSAATVTSTMWLPIVDRGYSASLVGVPIAGFLIAPCRQEAIANYFWHSSVTGDRNLSASGNGNNQFALAVFSLYHRPVDSLLFR